MHCPACQGALNPVNYENVEIDRCSSCSGVWLDDGEIIDIINTVDESFSQEEREQAFAKKGLDHREPSSIKCPKCSNPLKVIHYLYNSGVFIDRCPQGHGIWLDAGELKKIQIFQEQALGLHQKKSLQIHKEQKVCPRDGTALKEIKYETELLDLCDCCGGVWLDSDELQKVIVSRQVAFGETDHSDIQAKEENKIHQEQGVHLMGCIVCSSPMTPINFSYSSGIMIDRCPNGHGVWLDHHELERIQIFAERWQDTMPDLGERYSQLLSRAAKEASKSFDRAVKEGRDKALSKTALGSFLKKAGL